MNLRTGRGTWLAAGAVAGLLVGGGGIAVATTAATTSSIVACVGADGVMRMAGELESAQAGAAGLAAPTPTATAPTSVCRVGERTVTWNVAGPEGPQGPQGATGPQGPKGDKGEPGATYGQTYIAQKSPSYERGTRVEVARIPQVPAGDYVIQTSVNTKIVLPSLGSQTVTCEVGTPTGVTSAMPRQSGYSKSDGGILLSFFVTAKLDAPGPVVLTCELSSENYVRVTSESRLMATSVPQVVTTSPSATPSAPPTATPSAPPTATPSAPPTATPSAPPTATPSR